MRNARVQCLVVGGGVAGSALALHLLRRGLDVLLVDDGRLRRSGPFETVLGATVAVWQRSPLAEALLSAAAVDPLRHGAIWGKDELVWQEGAVPGLLLERGAFDARLRAAAQRAGARIHRGGVRRNRSGWLVTGEDGSLEVAAEAVAFATGRAMRHEALPEAVAAGPGTIAVTLVGAPAAEDRGAAVVEAVADGWIWTHAPATGPASAAVLVDHAMARQDGTRRLVERVLRASRGPASRLGAPRVAYANDATARQRAPSHDVFVLGDAAASIDPLASQGVEKAVAAAEHAAAAIATAVRRPEWTSRLCDLHQRWEVGLASAHAAVAAGFYREECRFVGAPFWSARRDAPVDPAALDPRAPLVVAPEVREDRVLVRSGDEVVEVDGVVQTVGGASVARIGSVSARAALRLFAAPRTIAVALADAGRDPALFVTSPRAVEFAVQELWRRGFLRPVPTAATPP